MFFCIDKSQDDLDDSRDHFDDLEEEDDQNEILLIQKEAFVLYPLYSQFDYMGVAQRVVAHVDVSFDSYVPYSYMPKILCCYVNLGGELVSAEFHALDLIALYEDKNESKKDESTV